MFVDEPNDVFRSDKGRAGNAVPPVEVSSTSGVVVRQGLSCLEVGPVPVERLVESDNTRLDCDAGAFGDGTVC